MKPCSRRAGKILNTLQNISVSPTIASVKGKVILNTKESYKDCLLILMNKANFTPIYVTKPQQDGSYEFLNLNPNINCVLFALDLNKNFTAVVEDYIIPK